MEPETETGTKLEIETQGAPIAGTVFPSCTHEWCACILLSNGYMTGFMSCALSLLLYSLRLPFQ